MKIQISDIVQMPVDTETGRDFDNLTMCTLHLKDGTIADVLFDKYGQLVTWHKRLSALSEFFDKKFVPGQIDGQNCLVSINQSNE